MPLVKGDKVVLAEERREYHLRSMEVLAPSMYKAYVKNGYLVVDRTIQDEFCFVTNGADDRTYLLPTHRVQKYAPIKQEKIEVD